MKCRNVIHIVPMAKAVFVCSPRQRDLTIKLIKPLGAYLQEQLGSSTPLYMHYDMDNPYGSEGLLVVGRHNSELINRSSALVGALLSSGGNSKTIAESALDGSFALFRSGPEKVEIITDSAGSRSVWIFKSKDLFIASTSQRAMVYLLGDFQCNPYILPWMISTGSLGIGNSWDTRLSALPPRSHCILNRSSWHLIVDCIEPDFRASFLRGEDALRAMRFEIESLSRDLSFMPQSTSLSLSGGRDSRALLDTASKAGLIRADTWFSQPQAGAADSDYQVARSAAEQYGLIHVLHHLDISRSSPAELLRRFILLGEGRTDNVAGYVDGFRAWEKIAHDGIALMLRGDEFFGRPEVSSCDDVLRIFPAISDFDNLLPIAPCLQARHQALPLAVQQREGETLAAWRDRIDVSYARPVMLSPLHDLKSVFTEVLNPFQAIRFMELSQNLADEERTNKTCFKRWISLELAHAPFATVKATLQRRDIASHAPIKKFLLDRLSEGREQSNIPSHVHDYIFANVLQDSPVKLDGLRWTAKTKNRKLNFDLLNLRCVIYSETVNQLFRDSSAGRDALKAICS